MGTNAALMTKKVIDNSYQVLAIEMISILQAVDYLDIKDRLSSYSLSKYEDLRKRLNEELTNWTLCSHEVDEFLKTTDE